SPVGISSRESMKARDSRIAWTAFYRRAESDRFDPGPDNIIGTTDDVRVPGDPHLIELIVVVTRRPSSQHRFALEDFPLPSVDFSQPPARVAPGANIPPADAIGWDRLAPTPWLVTFTSLPLLTPDTTMSATGPGDYYPYKPNSTILGDRPLKSNFV